MNLINVLWKIALNPLLGSATIINWEKNKQLSLQADEVCYFDAVFLVATLWCHFKVQYKSQVWTQLQIYIFSFLISTIQIDNKEKDTCNYAAYKVAIIFMKDGFFEECEHKTQVIWHFIVSCIILSIHT